MSQKTAQPGEATTPHSSTRRQASPLISSLRENLRGIHPLPYHIDWDQAKWEAKFPENCSPYENNIRNFGVMSGKLLRACWSRLTALQSEFCVVSAAIEWLNLQLPEFREALQARFSSLKDELAHVANTQLNLTQDAFAEVLIDAVSTVQWQFYKAKTVTVPKSHPKRLLEIGAAVLKEMTEDLLLLQVLTFLFDRLLFLGGEVVFQGSKIYAAAGTSLGGAEYLQQRALSTALDADMYHDTRRGCLTRAEKEPLWWPRYKLVRRIVPSGDGNVVEFATSRVDKIRASAISHLRCRSGSEYLFATLFKSSIESEDDEPAERPTRFESKYVHAIYAWDVIHSMANALVEAGPASDRHFSHSFERTGLLRLISDALDISLDQAVDAVDFLTLDGESRDGIWSRPLFLGSDGRYRLNSFAVLTVDPIRLLNLFVGNADKSGRRGHVFERRVLEAFRATSLLNRACQFTVLDEDHEVHKLLKKIPTDIILQEGNTLLLVEAKSTGHVADPREYDRAEVAIEKAFCQLTTRIDTLKRNKHKVLKAFGVDTEPRYLGLVVTNGRFFEGIDRHPYPVLDFRNLTLFLTVNELVGTIVSYTDYQGLFKTTKSPTSLQGMNQLESIHALARIHPQLALNRELIVSFSQALQIGDLTVSFDRSGRETALALVMPPWLPFWSTNSIGLDWVALQNSVVDAVREAVETSPSDHTGGSR